MSLAGLSNVINQKNWMNARVNQLVVDGPFTVPGVLINGTTISATSGATQTVDIPNTGIVQPSTSKFITKDCTTQQTINSSLLVTNAFLGSGSQGLGITHTPPTSFIHSHPYDAGIYLSSKYASDAAHRFAPCIQLDYNGNTTQSAPSSAGILVGAYSDGKSQVCGLITAPAWNQAAGVTTNDSGIDLLGYNFGGTGTGNYTCWMGPVRGATINFGANDQDPLYSNIALTTNFYVQAGSGSSGTGSHIYLGSNFGPGRLHIADTTTSGFSSTIQQGTLAANRTYTIPDTGRDAYFQMNLFQTVSVFNAQSMSVAQSGSLLSVTIGSSGYTITLPTPGVASTGCKYTVVVATSGTATVKIDSGAANSMFGTAISCPNGAGSGVNAGAAGQRILNIVGTSAQIGDTIDLWCNGGAWFARGMMATTGAMTFTAS